MNIEPINIGTANEIVINSNDNLKTQAVFYYRLLQDGKQLEDGNVTMTVEEYLNWDGTNIAAYEFVCKKLNLTLIKQ